MPTKFFFNFEIYFNMLTCGNDASNVSIYYPFCQLADWGWPIGQNFRNALMTIRRIPTTRRLIASGNSATLSINPWTALHGIVFVHSTPNISLIEKICISLSINCAMDLKINKTALENIKKIPNTFILFILRPVFYDVYM